MVFVLVLTKGRKVSFQLSAFWEDSYFPTISLFPSSTIASLLPLVD
jgi:hypothetical protein